MTPEDLAKRHPRLFHLTLPYLMPVIEQHGLLSTSTMLDGMGPDDASCAAIERARRPAAVPLDHPTLGPIILNNQTPMTEKALAGCLDDGLTPADWLLTLNRQVFFWCSEHGPASVLCARTNRGPTLRHHHRTAVLGQRPASHDHLELHRHRIHLRQPRRARHEWRWHAKLRPRPNSYPHVAFFHLPDDGLEPILSG